MAARRGKPKNTAFSGHIASTVTLTDPRTKKPFTAYCTRVTAPWFYDTKPYNVFRRYSDFVALRKALDKAFSADGKKELKGRLVLPKKKALGMGWGGFHGLVRSNVYM